MFTLLQYYKAIFNNGTWKYYDDIPEKYFPIADAIMDRMAANAHRIELKGESLRKNRSDKKV